MTLFDDRLALARKLADERRFGDAITLFNWLVEAYPDRAAAVVDSANAFSRVYDYAGVHARIAHVKSRPGSPPEVWTAMAQIGERLRRPQWARDALNNAVACSPPSAEACGQFARFLERSNELDRAAELCERGLKIDPSDPTCQLINARILRRQKSYQSAGETIERLQKNNTAPPSTLISAGYELAHVRDAQDDCPAAMAALLHAKQLALSQPEYAAFLHRAMSNEQDFHRLLTTVDAEYFEACDRWIPQTSHRVALLGGHPRSGTTLLEQILDSHSGIISAEETMVFGSTVNDPLVREFTGPDPCQAALQIPTNRVEFLRAAYLQTMESVLDQPIGNRLLVDKNPSYTDCIPMFARAFPEAFFVIALRDPRDVVLSCFFQDLPLNEISVRFQTLGETVMRYANTMAMWLTCRENMDEKKWIEMRYESLVSDLPGQAAVVMSKLNLAPEPAQFQPQLHAQQHPVASPTYADVAQPVHARAIGKWKRYEPWLREVSPTLETFLTAFDY